MVSNIERIAQLETKIEALSEDLRSERDEFKALKAEFAATQKKIARAETWGRATIWTLIAVSGFLTQLQGFIAWIRKL